MGAQDPRSVMASIAVLLSCTGLLAAEPESAAAPAVAAPASASAPSRGGAPRPYQAPIQVPSAAGQIRTPALPAPAVGITPAAPPTFTGTCDSSGCWGSDGTRYNAIGGALVRPDGRLCQNVGGVMQCP
jgi:hypothetical protein